MAINAAVIYMIRRAAALFLLLIIGWLLFSCNQPVKPILEQEPPPGMGAFSLSVAGIASRTILPENIGLDDFAGFTLVFSGASIVTVNRTPANLSDPVILPIGTYSLTVTAFTAAGFAAQGQTNGIVIQEGHSISRMVTIYLLPADGSGTGTFSWDIDFPAGLTAANMRITSADDPPGTPEQTLNLLGGAAPDHRAASVTLITGNYRVLFTLEKADAYNPTVQRQDALHVYPNMTSHFKYTFSDVYFNNTHYTVTFDENFPGGAVFDQPVIHGNVVPEPDPKPARSSYTFSGWYEEADGITVWDFNTPITEDITLYAQWQPAYLITITSQPAAARTVTQGYITGSLSVTASVTPDIMLGYQWYSNNTNSTTGGNPIPGAEDAVFDLPSDLVEGMYYYYCEVTAAGAVSVHSNVAVITVIPYGGSGGGVDGDPFLIYTEEQLRQVGRGTGDYAEWTLSAHYKLMADITLTSNWTAIPGSFTGSFDGDGYVITGLTITITAFTSNQGMFSVIDSSGEVKNLGLVDVTIIHSAGLSSFPTSNYGGIAGQNDGSITNCFVTGSVTIGGGNTQRSSFGGIAGSNTGTIENCYSTATVSANTTAGGIIGYNTGTVRNSVALGASVSSGRVLGSGTGDNNYARDDMTVLENMVSSGTGAATIHGESVTLGTAISAVFGINGVNFDTDIWDIPSGNIIVGGQLPRLKNTAQYPTLPQGAVTIPMDGSGTEDDPYLVTQANVTAFNLYARTAGLGRHYRLIENVVLSGTSDWTPIGSTATPFTGSFDGGGYIISGLTITITATLINNQGMFSVIGSSGEVKNLGLVDAVIIHNAGASSFPTSNYGGIAGQNDGSITNCFVTGSVTIGGGNTQRSSFGGIVGSNTGTIENCYSTATVSANTTAGGIIGYNTGTVRNSVALGASVSSGRVLGSGTGENNYARDDMTLSAGVLSPGATTKDGKSISSGEWQDEVWWRGIGFDTVNWPAARLPLDLP